MTETFEVGQKVKHALHGEGEVKYGPYRAAYDEVMYLVEFGDGRTWLITPGNLSAVPDAPAFAVGDKVTTSLYGAGTLVAGPYAGRYGDERWAVELTGGKHVFPASEALTKVVSPEPIKVGDRVRVTDDDGGGRNRFNGLIGVVKALRGEGCSLPYLVEFGDGRGYHGALNGQWNCGAVERVDDADTYTYNGVTYDLSAKYCDRDGDDWTFTRFGDRVTGAMNGTPADERFRTLGSVVDAYGPLTRV
ncbi:phiSA1p31-related protein [Streptomyces sp. NPDC058272]|uniref:phiSA1p31-related protein n=1 Tax=Streptomyces sp. NPDC058272 TaxID=3346415 RepID=UPI0036EFD105